MAYFEWHSANLAALAEEDAHRLLIMHGPYKACHVYECSTVCHYWQI